MTAEMVLVRGRVSGATLSLALRHGASVLAGRVLDALSGGGREV